MMSQDPQARLEAPGVPIPILLNQLLPRMEKVLMDVTRMDPAKMVAQHHPCGSHLWEDEEVGIKAGLNQAMTTKFTSLHHDWNSYYFYQSANNWDVDHP